MGKYSTWYENQNATTKAWLDKQAIWHDSDMVKAFAVGSVIGFIIGAMFI